MWATITQVSAELPKDLFVMGGAASLAVRVVSNEFLGGAEPGGTLAYFAFKVRMYFTIASRPLSPSAEL
jgi:hypothetical protein